VVATEDGLGPLPGRAPERHVLEHIVRSNRVIGCSIEAFDGRAANFVTTDAEAFEQVGGPAPLQRAPIAPGQPTPGPLVLEARFWVRVGQVVQKIGSFDRRISL
jgi:hypothetical protein